MVIFFECVYEMGTIQYLLFGDEIEEERKCGYCEKEINSHVARERVENSRIIYFCTWKCYSEYFQNV